tara:strand:- start:500 stop:850 length:351 start_codon:yes stop_codon:yes gene_type:complete
MRITEKRLRRIIRKELVNESAINDFMKSIGRKVKSGAESVVDTISGNYYTDALGKKAFKLFREEIVYKYGQLKQRRGGGNPAEKAFVKECQLAYGNEITKDLLEVLAKMRNSDFAP